MNKETFWQSFTTHQNLLILLVVLLVFLSGLVTQYFDPYGGGNYIMLLSLFLLLVDVYKVYSGLNKDK